MNRYGIRAVAGFLMMSLFLVLVIAPAAFGADFRKRMSASADIATLEDINAEILFGREVGARVLGRHGIYDNSEIARYVSLVGKSVAGYTNRPEIEFHFAVLNTDSINAYAAPGGYIFVTRGALMQMRDESELAAVLAHEMAHVTGRHIVRELNIRADESSPVAGFARFLGGSGDPAKIAFLNMVDKALEILFEKGYKVEDEIEADETSAVYLALAGYNPASLSEYLGRIKSQKGEETGVLSRTHPPFDERINRINSTLEKEGLMPGKYMKSAERFDEIKKKI